MRRLVAVAALLCFDPAWGADHQPPAAPAAVVKGRVLEVKDVENYTYLRLKTKDGETWAAVNKTPVKKGAEVTIENPMFMSNFESKALKRTFQQIVLGNLGGAGGQAGGMPPGHGMGKPAAEVGDVNVAKASGPDARTVAEVVGQSAALKDKTVVVRGKVVKYTDLVMGKNWIHLRDGSGTAVDGTNDILVTTTDQAKIGDVVLVKGVVHTDQDFGSGYAYKVLIGEATLQK
ncbi:MAG TPA: hypothetical protein VMB75_09595 [Rhodocyclaceae bacterium]|nr:hypothetical protein [Rhodocyclaceae bacterium]